MDRDSRSRSGPRTPALGYIALLTPEEQQARIRQLAGAGWSERDLVRLTGLSAELVRRAIAAAQPSKQPRCAPHDRATDVEHRGEGRGRHEADETGVRQPVKDRPRDCRHSGSSGSGSGQRPMVGRAQYNGDAEPYSDSHFGPAPVPDTTAHTRPSPSDAAEDSAPATAAATP